MQFPRTQPNLAEVWHESVQFGLPDQGEADAVEKLYNPCGCLSEKVNEIYKDYDCTGSGCSGQAENCGNVCVWWIKWMKTDENVSNTWEW